jgi:hypothetical protein
MNMPPATAADRFAALESAALAKDDLERFYALVDLAKVALEASDLEKAAAYAQELLKMAPQLNSFGLSSPLKIANPGHELPCGSAHPDG